MSGADYIDIILHNLCNVSAPFYIIYEESVLTLKTFAKSNVSTEDSYWCFHIAKLLLLVKII